MRIFSVVALICILALAPNPSYSSEPRGKRVRRVRFQIRTLRIHEPGADRRGAFLVRVRKFFTGGRVSRTCEEVFGGGRSQDFRLVACQKRIQRFRRARNGVRSAVQSEENGEPGAFRKIQRGRSRILCFLVDGRTRIRNARMGGLTPGASPARVGGLTSLMK